MYRFFRAEELQQIVVGAVVIDWKQIEDNAKYHDGKFTKNLKSIFKNFLKNFRIHLGPPGCKGFLVGLSPTIGQ